MRKFNPEKELSKIKNGNKNKIIVGLCTLLLIVIVGYSFALYQVRHTQKLVFNTVAEFKKRDIYLSVLVDGEYQNDFPAKEEGMLYGGYECDGDAKINFDTEQWQVALYASHPDKCTIKFGHKYVDQSGANYPELYQGMIPVYFENGKIYVADITSEWYNYDENKWANAVLIDYANKKDKFYDDNGNLLGGHEVGEEDILQMYVWIPRYKYQLWNVNNEGKPKQLINIEFEEDTGNIKCIYTNNGDGTITEDCKDKNTQAPAKNADWYTHPAFTFKGTTKENGTELKGIWIGKFESSDPTNENGRTYMNKINGITILPNKTSVVGNNISTIFYEIRNIELVNFAKYNINNTKIDTHLMKNNEWGAMAYLTQSIYGIYKDEKTCNIDDMTFEDCEVWLNNVAQGEGNGSQTYTYGGTATGCTGTSVSSRVEWNKAEPGSPVDCPSGRKWNESGINSSTTGNMYGIYDISGGAYEYTMGVTLNENDKTINLGGSGFVANVFQDPASIESKYYDIYTFSDKNTTHERGHLGDATREIIETFEIGNGAWNKDWAVFPNKALPWMERGGYIDAGAAGVFAFHGMTGVAANSVSFRVVLTAQDGNE